MRRIGILLTIALLAFIAFTAPAGAAGPNAPASDTTTQGNGGKGMNREGGSSEHPGKGWRDPGQDQGSPANQADPDCTGNRTQGPQGTNIGDCDDPDGAADKPGGSGGFDDDRDWNNGCGNDADLEDDNNGMCGGPTGRHDAPDDKPKPDAPDEKPKPVTPEPEAEAPAPPTAPTAPTEPTEVLRSDHERPAPLQPAPTPVEITVSREAPGPRTLHTAPGTREELPATGAPIGQITTIGLGLVGVGVMLLRSQRRKPRW